jgi:hypothetical protein
VIFFKYFAISAFVMIFGGFAERIARSTAPKIDMSIKRISSAFSTVMISTIAYFSLTTAAFLM